MKYNLAILFLFCCMYATAQQTLKLEHNIQITLPQGSVKFSDQEYKNKLLVTLPLELVEGLTINSYKNDDVILRFQGIKNQPKSDFLVQKKKLFDGMLGSGQAKNPGYGSVIKTIAGNSVLIVTKDLKDTAGLEYYCYHAETNTAFMGTMVCPPKDIDKAKTLLNTLLNQVKF